jgi:hypothetical protein
MGYLIKIDPGFTTGLNFWKSIKNAFSRLTFPIGAHIMYLGSGKKRKILRHILLQKKFRFLSSPCLPSPTPTVPHLPS